MFNFICLASGGLDSIVCMRLMQKADTSFLPVFVDFGQVAASKEYSSLLRACREFGFGEPVKLDIPGFGHTVKSGLTNETLDVFADAFTPNRNLLFAVAGAAVGYQRGCFNIVLGFLERESTIFPDQTDTFLQATEKALSASLGTAIAIHCPLREFSKKSVVELGLQLGVVQYYSCHKGGQEPCGRCIACLEYGG